MRPRDDGKVPVTTPTQPREHKLCAYSGDGISAAIDLVMTFNGEVVKDGAIKVTAYFDVN